MTSRRFRHRDFLTKTSWLWLIALGCLSGRCLGQTYNGFGYSVSGSDITITSYTGPGGAVMIPPSIPGLPGVVTSIGNYAFLYSAVLTSVAIPSSVTSIGDGAFYRCSGLTNVTIPSSVTNIGGYAFCWCGGLTGITIPSTVTRIGDRAFYGCGGLTNVTVPDSVTDIGTNAFLDCSGLAAIVVEANNSAYSSLGGVLFDKSRTTLIQCPPGATGAYTIPGGVTSIGGYAFQGCSNLTGIAIPNGVINIGAYAFNGCSGSQILA